MSLFQSKCRYRVAEQCILDPYEPNYNMVEAFNYSFPNLTQIDGFTTVQQTIRGTIQR
jgi:hypothetical protein